MADLMRCFPEYAVRLGNDANKCCCNVGPPSTTLAQHYSNLCIISKSAGLKSDMKTHEPTLHFTPWSLDLFIHVQFQLHGENTVLQPFWRIELIVHIAISVLPGTHFNLQLSK